MNGSDPGNRLRDLLERVPDTPPPVDALVAAGERAHRARRARLAGVGAAAAVVVVALASLVVVRPDDTTPAPPPSAQVELAGRWDVVELRDGTGRRIDLVTNLRGRVGLRFDPAENEYVGSDGCNAFFGGYRLEGVDLRMQPPGATEVGCRPDMVLIQRLPDVASLRAGGGTLTVLDRDGRLVARLARPLPTLTGESQVRTIAATKLLPAFDAGQTSWPDPVLLQLDPSPRGQPLTGARPGDGVLWADTGCNTTGGAYRQRGATLRARPGTLATSLVGCASEPAVHEVVDQMALATAPDERTLVLRDRTGRALARLERLY